jgi:hypothetical protein
VTDPRDPIDLEVMLGLRPSSPAWRATVRAWYGTSTPEDAELFRALSGGVDPPEGGAEEVLAVVGRRGGKSSTIARVAVFEALYGRHHVGLEPGQLGIIPIISPRNAQSAEILNYAKGIAGHRLFTKRVAGTTAESVTFTNGIEIRVATCDIFAASGPTFVCLIRDEWAKYPGAESATSDVEIDATARPAMARVVGAPPRRLIGITSAFIDEGLAWQTDLEHFGKPGAPVLVVRGATDVFNPNIDPKVLERERSRSPRTYAREYECEWGTSIVEAWFPHDAIERCTDVGRFVADVKVLPETEYSLAIDAAFSGDGFGVCVLHRERPAGENGEPVNGPPRTVVDVAHAWKAKAGERLSVWDTLEQVAELARAFHTSDIHADQASFDAIKEIGAKMGLALHQTAWTRQNKAPLYRRVRDALVDGHIRLPDDKPLIRELRGMRGRLLRSGGEQIEARGSGKDDRVSALVLAFAHAGQVAEWTETSRSGLPDSFFVGMPKRRDHGWLTDSAIPPNY